MAPGLERHRVIGTAVRVASLAAIVLMTACGEPAPSPTASAPESDSAELREPGVADAPTARDLLPQRVDPPWELMEADPQPAPAQFDSWATDLTIAVVFDAAVAAARYDGQNIVSITAFAAPDQRIDAQLANGPGFARRWIEAYGCAEPRVIGLAGVAVTTLPAQANCSPHYLMAFRDQLVVIQDGPGVGQVTLEPDAIAQLVAAIVEEAEDGESSRGDP